MDVIKLVLKAHGLKSLNPVQRLAVERGLLGSKNMLIVSPTASGKTLIGEIAMIKAILEEGKKAVYLSPLRALASEKYHAFKETRPQLKVGISTGDFHTSGKELSQYDLIVCTYERFDSLIRNRAPRLSDVGVVVFDEIHLINAAKRGPVVEMIAARLDTRYIGLSATIGNPEELANRLNAELIVSDRRPVRLVYGALLDTRYSKQIIWEDGRKEKLQGKDAYEVIIRRTLRTPLGALLDEDAGEGQVLIFANARSRAESLAKRLSEFVRRFLDQETMKELLRYSSELSEVASHDKERILSELLPNGVAFHHAGLSHDARRIVEEAFRKRLIKVLVATPTLAAGVNLPARVVVPFLTRYDPTLGMSVEIPVIEFRQMAGRAGRPDYDPYGEVITIVKDLKMLKKYFDVYVFGPVEPVKSRLTQMRSLTEFTLVAIAEGYRSDEDLEYLFSRTLAYKQAPDLLSRLHEALERLRDRNMIEKHHEYVPTLAGKLTVRFYLYPRTVYRALMYFSEYEPTDEVYPYLHTLFFLDDVAEAIPGRLFKRGREEPLGNTFVEDFFDDREMVASYRFANLLYYRIEEEDLNEILNLYDLYPGDFAALKDTVERVVYSLSRILKAVAEAERDERLLEHAKRLAALVPRIRYGIREELLELVQLRGVGRVIARRLYEAGIRTIEDVLRNCHRLTQIPGIGEKRAKAICSSARELLKDRT